MDHCRRTALRLLGAAGSGLALAGCLSDDEPGTPNGDDDGKGEFQHVDEPPYDITEQDCPQSGEERDPLWLCADIPDSPSVSFEQVETSSSVLDGEGLQEDPDTGAVQLYATLLLDSDDRSRIDRSLETSATELIEGTDFQSAGILIAQTGWGSGTVTPHIKRVESTDGRLHAVGCYRRPCGQTDDVTARATVVRFQRPDAIDSATVSLIADPATRLHVWSTDGVVTVLDDS